MLKFAYGLATPNSPLAMHSPSKDVPTIAGSHDRRDRRVARAGSSSARVAFVIDDGCFASAVRKNAMTRKDSA
ncbi:hypothetical protein, partial [Salinisphaera sp.]|uniref:hypothetical protein n=1 Tax=Salinisphaera sp. TaxID=1914330 RepID=UPI0025DD7F19